MGGIIDSIKKRTLYQAQNNLLYIVSFQLTQEKIAVNRSNIFAMCNQSPNEQKVKNFPLISFKFETGKIKYTKYEYRQYNVIQMIMLTPQIFVSLTDEGLQLWYDNYGIQKITAQFFDKLKNQNNSNIKNCIIKKFDEDLFFLSFIMIPKSQNIKTNDLQGPQFILFSAKKIINEGKIIESFSINKIEYAFPISPHQIFIINKGEIKIIDYREKKSFKVDKNLEILKNNISFSCYLIYDLVLISSEEKGQSVIYSADKLDVIYYISDNVNVAFPLGNNKVILVGQTIKEMVIFPEMQVFSLAQYETDIFGSVETKNFYPINDNCFLFINHKNKKLKEVYINEYNELIIKKEIICPSDYINFCPFVYLFEEEIKLFCALFICRDQTYFLKNEELEQLSINSYESSYSSIKRLFLSFFEYKYIQKLDTEGEETIKKLGVEKKINQKKEIDINYLPFAIIPSAGISTLNFSAMKKKMLHELECSYNYFEPGVKIEMITSNNNNEIYLVSIIKNKIIYICKINDVESEAKNEKFNFGEKVKTNGIVNLGKYIAFIYYDKKGILINVAQSFKTQINPLDTFLFPFEIFYAYNNYEKKIILISKTQMFVFDYYTKKIEKELTFGFEVTQDGELNISKIQDNIFIFINDLKYILFDINTFTIIYDLQNYNVKNCNFLFFNSMAKSFEIIKKDLKKNQVIQVFKQETDEEKHKIKYLSNNNLFVGTFPNKFFIFENN